MSTFAAFVDSFALRQLVPELLGGGASLAPVRHSRPHETHQQLSV